MTGTADAAPAGDSAAGSSPPKRPFLARARRALAAGFFPTVLGAHAGGLVWSLGGLPYHGGLYALLAFAAVFLATRAILRALWRRPAGRTFAKIAIAAHVVFWSGHGILRTQVREAGPVEARVATVWQGPPQAFLAGYGEASFSVTGSDTLAGFGKAPRRLAAPWPAPGPALLASLALMERKDDGGAPRVPMFRHGVPGTEFLGAKAVVIRAAGKAPPLAICRLDLVMCDAHLRDAILARVSDLGFVEDTLLVSATHTHSGPGGFTRTCLACALAVDHFRPEVFERTVVAGVSAIRAAHAAAAPARIGFVRARDQGADGRPLLAKNRAQETGRDRVDREVLGIRLDAADGERRIALILNYAVHPTWARPKDDRFSPDVAGALEASAEIASGAPVLFVNGAEGDVSPRTALAIGAARDEKAVLLAFEKAVGKDLAPRGTADALRVAAATVRRDLGSMRFLVPFAGERGTLYDAAERPFSSGIANGVGNALCLPLNAVLWSAGLSDVRLSATPRGSVGLYVALDPYVETRAWPFGAVRLETEAGAVAIVAVPGELTTAVGEKAKESARLRGAGRAFVFGLTGDHFAYCATADECAQGTYEGQTTLCGDDQSTRVLEAIDAALEAVGFRSPEPTK